MTYPDYIDPAIGIPLAAAICLLWIVRELRERKGK